MTLLDALDACRFIDLAEPLEQPPMLRSVLAWRRTCPIKLVDLYMAAGMPFPAGFEPVSLPTEQAVEQPAQVPGAAYRSSAKSSVARLYAILLDYQPHGMSELSQALGIIPDRVHRALYVLRKKGTPVDGVRIGRRAHTYQLRRRAGLGVGVNA